MHETGRALRLLHDGDYVRAIEAFRNLLDEASFPSNVSFLARAYEQTGQVTSAIEVLRRGLEAHAGDRLLSKQLVETERGRYELLIRFAVRPVSTLPAESFYAELLAQNAELADGRLREVLYENAIHYAQRMAVAVLRPLVMLHEALGRRIGGDSILADAAELRGLLAYTQSDMVEALDRFRQACRFPALTETSQKRAGRLNHLAMAAAACGELAEAETAFTEAIALCEAVGDHLNAARFEENVAGMYLDVDPGRALELATATERRYVALGNVELTLQVRSLRGKCLAALGRREAALELLEECIDRGRTIETSMLMVADALVAKSFVLEDDLRLQAAAGAAEEAQAIYAGLGIERDRGSRGAGISRVLNRFDTAEQELTAAVSRLEASGMKIAAAMEKSNLAGVYLSRIATQSMAGADPSLSEVSEGLQLVSKASRLVREAMALLERTQAPFVLVRLKMQHASLLRLEATLQRDPGPLNRVLEEEDELVAMCQRHGYDSLLLKVMENKVALLEDLGRGEEAKAALEKRMAAAPEKEPQTSHHCSLLAQRFASSGNHQRARSLFQRALTLYAREEAGVGDVVWQVAWSRSEVHLFDKAIEFFVELDDWRTAFSVAAQGKGRSFRRIMRSRLDQSDPPPDDSLDRIAALLELEPAKAPS